MKRLWSTLVLLSGFLVASSTSVPAGKGFVPADLPDIVERILPSVVNISSTTVVTYSVPGWDEFLPFFGIPRERKHSSLGSGFILDGEGYVITNNHVIDRASEVKIALADKREFVARIVGKDPKLDLALLQIQDKAGKVPGTLTPVRLADSDKVRIAEPVIAIGNPFGYSHTVTTGIISAKDRTIGFGPLDNFLQTDADINPGNSGGPLFNLRGEVIGINTLIRSNTGQSAGLGFAIPINDALREIPDLKKYGRVPRPWLGILTEPLTPQLARYHRLPAREGLLVYNLVERGPADQSGITPGDVILSANGVKVLAPLDLEKILVKLKPDDTITLVLAGRKKNRTLKVKMKEFPPRLDNRLPQGIL